MEAEVGKYRCTTLDRVDVLHELQNRSAFGSDETEIEKTCRLLQTRTQRCNLKTVYFGAVTITVRMSCV